MARVLLGNIKGPTGDTGPAGATGPQGDAGNTPIKGTDYFTDEDIKSLSAYFAPAGYGLGEDTKQHITLDQLDTTYTSGLYWVTCPGTIVNDKLFDYGLMRVSGMGTTHVIQELFPLGYDMVLIRRFDGNVWTLWGAITWNAQITLGGV